VVVILWVGAIRVAAIRSVVIIRVGAIRVVAIRVVAIIRAAPVLVEVLAGEVLEGEGGPPPSRSSRSRRPR
jgi:hypothetical protein